MKSLALAAALALIPSACNSVHEQARHSSEDIVAELMTGAFSSAAQSAIDSRYFDIRMTIVPIWPNRSDGPWLYAEQAISDSLDEPFRQRVLHLVGDAGTVHTEIYELPGEPTDFAGAWRTPAMFDSITPILLTERTGCAVHLEEALAFVWKGSTIGEGCSSDVQGASYATSTFTLTETFVEMWHRGFDADGNQVWGVEESGYVFDRIEMPE